MAGTPAHDCPATGCTRRVGRGQLLCRPHWFAVPKALRDAVWDAWRGGLGAGSAAHRDAILAAVEAVNAKLREQEGKQ
jgi:hypothetical protein